MTKPRKQQRQRRMELADLWHQAERLRAEIERAEIARRVEQIAVTAGVLDELDLPAADLGEGE
jgi:hypothetical protein